MPLAEDLIKTATPFWASVACFFSMGLEAREVRVLAMESRPSEMILRSPLSEATALGSRLPETGAFFGVVPIAAAAVPGRFASEYGLLEEKTLSLGQKNMRSNKYCAKQFVILPGANITILLG